MQIPVLAMFTACLLSLCSLSGCADESVGTTPSLYYRSVQAPLSASIESGLSAISKAKPLSPELRETVRTAVKTFNHRNARQSKAQMDAIRKVGAGAIPVLADLLSSQDDLIRANSMVALGSLVPGRWKQTDYRYDNMEPVLTLLGQRSLLDRNARVRLLALGILGSIGFRHHGDVPQGVVAGLEQALSDPDEHVVHQAQVLKDWLGLAPHDRSHGMP